MWFSCLFYALASAASMTNSTEVDYQGNKEHRKMLLKMFGAQADQNALTLDDMLSNEVIVCSLFPYKEMPLDLHKLGVLLGDLSRVRFDELCTTLDNFKMDVTELVRGYAGEGSKWKDAMKSLPGNNLSAHLLSKMTPEYCDFLAAHPEEFLTRGCVKHCFDLWMDSEKHENVRKVLRHGAWFYLFYRDVSKSYVGREMEYIELLVAKLKDRSNFRLNVVFLPWFIQESHLQPLIQFAKSEECPHGLLIASDRDEPRMNALIDGLRKEIMERDPVFEEFGYDSEPFMGKWALPKRLMQWTQSMRPEIYKLIHNLPSSLNDAFDALWLYGNDHVLKNSICLLEELLTDTLPIQEEYYRWIALPRPYNQRIKQVAIMMKPYLKSLPHDLEKTWHLLPLFREMDSAPAFFWPEVLLAEGSKWVKEQLEQLAIGEDEILAGLKSEKWAVTPSLYSLGAYQSAWTKLRSVTAGVGNEVFALTFRRTPVAIEFFTAFGGERPEHVHKLFSDGMTAFTPNMAISSNHEMLNFLLTLFPVHTIIKGTPSAKIRNRIALMLHLNPKVPSYHGRERVNKNSIFFRNWVMLHLSAADGNKIGDLKLLFYYFRNRCLGLYDGFDLFNRDETGSDMILGILSDPYVETRRSENRNWDLTFESSGPIVEEEKVGEKRGREDDLQ